MNKKILVTGSSGFIGGALVEHLVKRGFNTIGASRNNTFIHPLYTFYKISSLEQGADWSTPLHNVDTVVHCAARAHILKEKVKSPIDEFRKINVEATLQLAKQACKAGVKRFIFISSIGVLGDETKRGIAFNESMPEDPKAIYAISKLEAEKALKKFAKSSGLELVIIRPALVYDVHAPGNFSRLLKLADSILPLPFKGVKNRRALIYLPNLIELITSCLTQKEAVGGLFLASDGQSVPISEIISKLREGMGRKTNIFWFPNCIIKALATMLGKKRIYTQLFRSLDIDTEHTKLTLGWSPTIETKDALIMVGKQYKLSKKGIIK